MFVGGLISHSVVGVSLHIVMSNILSYLMSLCSEFRVEISTTISACSVRTLSPFVCGGGVRVLFILFVFVGYSGVLYIRITGTASLRKHLRSPPAFGGVSVAHRYSFLCFSSVCLRPVPCVPICCQFLWIVHS